LSLIALQPDGGAKADLVLGTEEDMESENRDDRGGREGRRKKPRESQEGLGHSGMLSGSLEQRIVKI
jgi:hypothetical protein